MILFSQHRNAITPIMGVIFLILISFIIAMASFFFFKDFTDDAQNSISTTEFSTNLQTTILSSNRNEVYLRTSQENLNVTKVILDGTQCLGNEGLKPYKVLIVNISSCSSNLETIEPTLRIETTEFLIEEKLRIVDFQTINGSVTTREFSPLDISGLSIWLDADSIEGLNDNDSIETWNDLSGANKHAVQSNESIRPIYKEEGLNERSVVRFDGIDDYLVADSVFSDSTTATAFVVFKVPDTGIDLWLYGQWGPESHLHFFRNGKIDAFLRPNDLRVNNVGETISENRGHLSVWKLEDTSPARLSVWLDGSFSGDDTQSSFSQIGTHSEFAIGSDTTTGNRVLNGDIAEIIIYDTALSNSDREAVEQYLIDKWLDLFTPNSFNFSNVSLANLSTQYFSGPVEVTGFNGSHIANIEGHDSQISVDNSSWSSSVVVESGDSLYVRMNSSNNVEETREAKIRLGDYSTNWSITTRGFSPLDIGGLSIWFDADSIEDLNDSDSIETWEDLSGANKHAVQSTVMNRPIYKTGELNGKPVVRFDGTDDYLVAPAVLSGSARVTSFIVFKVPDTTPDLWFYGQWNPNRFLHFFRNSQIFVYLRPDDLLINNVGNTISENTGHLSVWKLEDTSPSRLSAWLDGNFSGDSTKSSFSQIGTHSEFAIGSDTTTGDRLLNGDIAEIIIYDSALSNTDRETVEQYLTSKWLE